MESVAPITHINAKTGRPGYALSVSHDPITDRRLSLADLGLYVRCLWLSDVCGDLGDVDWFIRELDMPEDETRAGLRRLADAGYIDVVAPEFAEARKAFLRAEAVREAAGEVWDQLNEDEFVAVARFIDLAKERSDRASQVSAAIALAEFEGIRTPEA
ncbi:hypothetical protein [Streptomyces sp. NRRL WC-3742]|uniref:hypothetical protein n=1 Tax=Streptomyces sp. NRRL WC-3742 TaxID=1463934 RepID=UPI0004C7A461|nr:hypothetical protein [Streptomyces sp. NRRL WC-3742]